MKNKVFGICHLCGKEAELSYEHIPPQSSFNKLKAKTYTMEQMMGRDALPWDISGLRYKQNQRGAGKYSLCKKCNNDTGTWYGEEYMKFHNTLAKMVIVKNGIIPNTYATISLKKVRPLPIIKQMLSMFCSINEPGIIDDDIKEFVLNKSATKIETKKYKLCMYITDSTNIQYAGYTVGGNIPSGEMYCVSEITTFPIGMILYFDPKPNMKYKGADITAFADCQYDNCYDIDMQIPMYEKNTLFPLDYRSKKEIIECRNKNI